MSAIPRPVARVADLMSTFRQTWLLCGGWAVDAWLGHRSRDHGDIDICIFHDVQHAFFDHLVGWQLIAHDVHVDPETTEPWDGRRLDLPAHVHARSDDGSDIDAVLNEQSAGDWILRREPRITSPLDRAHRSRWGVPTVVPEVLIFYKATGHVDDEELDGPRPHDELDFQALLPSLTAAQRAWLRTSIAQVDPHHGWLDAVAV